MKTKILKTIVTAILMSIAFTSCEQMIIGKWTSTSESYANNHIKGGKIHIDLPTLIYVFDSTNNGYRIMIGDKYEDKATFTYSITGTKLTTTYEDHEEIFEIKEFEDSRIVMDNYHYVSNDTSVYTHTHLVLAKNKELRDIDWKDKPDLPR